MLLAVHHISPKNAWVGFILRLSKNNNLLFCNDSLTSSLFIGWTICSSKYFFQWVFHHWKIPRDTMKFPFFYFHQPWFLSGPSTTFSNRSTMNQLWGHAEAQAKLLAVLLSGLAFRSNSRIFKNERWGIKAIRKNKNYKSKLGVLKVDCCFIYSCFLFYNLRCLTRCLGMSW